MVVLIRLIWKNPIEIVYFFDVLVHLNILYLTGCTGLMVLPDRIEDLVHVNIIRD